MKTARIPASRPTSKQINPMKNVSCSIVPPINSEDAEAVKPTQDPAWILALVDLIFLCKDEGRTVPS